MAKITQSSIAKRLGVSRQAVGYALGLYTNSNIKLNPETCQLIIKTADELGYRPNRLAQIISGRKSGVIGVMNFGGVTQMSAQNTLHVANAIQNAGYQPMIYDVTWYQKGGIENVTSTLLDNRVEGILLVAPTDWMPTAVLESIHREQVPVVSIGGIYLDGIPHVESDYYFGSYTLTKGLLDRGYRSFVYLTAFASLARTEIMLRSPRTQRLNGFRRAIEERGGMVEERPNLRQISQVYGEIYYSGQVSDWTDPYLVGDLGMQQILMRKRLPDVVLCSNDDWAAGALRACGREGIRIPEDISLAGYDGTVISNYGYIPLTTIIQPLEEISATGVRLLEQRIHKQPVSAKEMWVQIPSKVEWRSSTKPLKRERKDPESSARRR